MTSPMLLSGVGRLWWLVVLMLIVTFMPVSELRASGPVGALVSGQVISSANQKPIPGLTVQLLHPQLGRSQPAVTDRNGFFTFYDIPQRDTPFYLEILWGKEPVYRDQVLIRQDQVALPVIQL